MKRIILTIIIALLGIGLEVVNYYVFVLSLNVKLYKIGIATAGLYITFISIIGNIIINSMISKKEEI